MTSKWRILSQIKVQYIMPNLIVARKEEQKILKKFSESDKSEFIAIYGRRRVGKTYLIREFFDKKSCIFFRSSGIHKGKLKTQLDKFRKENP